MFLVKYWIVVLKNQYSIPDSIMCYSSPITRSLLHLIQPMLFASLIHPSWSRWSPTPSCWPRCRSRRRPELKLPNNFLKRAPEKSCTRHDLKIMPQLNPNSCRKIFYFCITVMILKELPDELLWKDIIRLLSSIRKISNKRISTW